MKGGDMPTVTKTWIGGGNNDASNRKDWSPSGPPQSGDDLIITGGTINIAGNHLAGDTLTLDGLVTSPITINTKNDAVLNLDSTLWGGVATSVHITGQLNLTAHAGDWDGALSFIGGSIKLIGTSGFDGAVFDADLKGNGTIDADHTGNGYLFGPLIFNGSVGRGVTIALEGGGPPEGVQIDHPSSFKGEIILPGPYNSNLGPLDGMIFEGSVLFEGLHITSADLIPCSDVLQMWNGKHLVDTVRVGGYTSDLYVQQTTAGVTLGTTYADTASKTPIIGNLFH
jgi:hypothetical protein